MKTLTASLTILLFAIAVGVSTPSAFAADMVTVEIAEGSSVAGCEKTAEGCYIPTEATVDMGGEVTWTNTDSAAHTVTSGMPGEDVVGELFDSGLFLAGTEFTEKFDGDKYETGDYPYFCLVHPWMTGVVTVVAASDDLDDDTMMPGDDNDKDGEGMMMMENAMEEGMLSDERMVSIEASAPTEGESMTVMAMFEDAKHVNYDLVVMQNGQVIFEEIMAHSHDGMETFETQALTSSDPVDIMITFQGYGLPDEEKTGPVGEQVVFSNIVPEFGTIAMIVLSVAIMSIIVLTARTRVIPRI
jgi:predicted secreted protein with PEFG-CTERM motif